MVTVMLEVSFFEAPSSQMVGYRRIWYVDKPGGLSKSVEPSMGAYLIGGLSMRGAYLIKLKLI